MAKRQFQFPWRVFFYILGLGTGLAGLVMLMGTISVKSSELACREMQIDILGEEAFVEHKDIAKLIDEEYGQLVGRTLESIPIHDMEQKLSTVPYVFRARVSTDMNGLLQVQIYQRKAVLRIADESGGGFYVDREGVKLPVSTGYVPQVPIANGYIAEQYVMPLDSMETDLVKGLFELAQFISNDSLWEKQIVQMYVNETGDIELIPRAGQHRIILGDVNNLKEKFENLLIYYRGIVPRVGPDAYEIVNLKYKDQLVCVRASGLINRDTLVDISSNSLNIQ